jgi:GGDEF domain-containing protein
MKYSRFEQLIIAIGALVIIGSLLLSLPSGGPGLVEGLAQLMLLAVLVAAVHYGRKGGLIAAILASAVYIVLRLPLLASTDGVTSATFFLILTRLGAYGLVGIVGGEICTRVKYIFARYDDSNTIDDWSRVYNQRYASHALEQARGRFARYGEPFSAVVLALSPSLTSELQPSRQRALVRGVAGYLRGDVRMVDEVSRLDDGRFLILLPHTPKEGGVIVNDRLASGVREVLGAREESVRAMCYGAAEDAVALSTLAADIHELSDDQDGSGTYTSDASSTRNPDERSASSATASSTFSTSTAASPDGSTKQ